MAEVDEESNKKFPIVEMVRNEINRLKWKQVDLVKASGVSHNAISRFLNNDGINSDNLVKILVALGFLKEGDAGHIFPGDNLIVLSGKKYPEFHSLVDCALESDKADQIVTAASAYIRGVLGLDDRISEELREIKEVLYKILDNLSGEPTQSKKKAK
jgi:transcriptional regulator with XRE-family HTH domain